MIRDVADDAKASPQVTHITLHKRTPLYKEHY